MKCICKIRNWFSNLGKTQDTKPKKESKYHSLTPTNCADNCEGYMDALQQALKIQILKILQLQVLMEQVKVVLLGHSLTIIMESIST